jgi:4-hydroxy-tetrahydrodipicolinate reductase
MDCKIGVIGSGKMGKTIEKIHPIFPITRTTPRQNLPCDVLIDVSSPDALEENLSCNRPIVIGTTGHKNFKIIEEAAKTLPIFFAPNFSLGVALFKKIALEIAKHFPAEIDLLETHHNQKKDAPSGTALLLSEQIPNMKIHSIRSGAIIGEHTLIFNNSEEQIRLTHTAHTREAFAKGAIRAAYFLKSQPPGLYTMDNLFS